MIELGQCIFDNVRYLFLVAEADSRRRNTPCQLKSPISVEQNDKLLGFNEFVVANLLCKLYCDFFVLDLNGTLAAFLSQVCRCNIEVYFFGTDLEASIIKSFTSSNSSL